jgi:hypothetical protein
MKMIKALWKGAKEERVHIKGDGYTAELHFVPGQEILLPEKSLEKLKDPILTKRLIMIERFHPEINNSLNLKESRRRRFKKESSITDSISEGVCE